MILQLYQNGSDDSTVNVTDFLMHEKRKQETKKFMIKIIGLVFVAIGLFTLSRHYQEVLIRHNREIIQEWLTSRNEEMANFAGFMTDACVGTSFRSRTDCCADPRFPVLGGVDVVALRSVQRGNPPALGKMEWAAALPTSEANYVFLFYSKENRDLFLGNPWFYAPRWGGFDAWEVAENDILKGDSAKKSLGMNTDVQVWLETMENQLVMFGGLDQRESFLLDVEHHIKTGDYKWKQWWGKTEAGVFNTRCFQGTSFSELVEATKKYDDSELIFGDNSAEYSGGASTYLKSFDRKKLRRAVAHGVLYYVHYGERAIERVRMEDSNGEGFALDTLVSELPGPKDVRLDLDAEMMYWTDMIEHTIRRCSMDGANSIGSTELIVSGVTKPALLQLDPEQQNLYFTSIQCAECDQYYIQYADMDGSDASVLVELVGQSRGISLSRSFSEPRIYYTDFFEGTLRTISITGEEKASEILLEDLISPTYLFVMDKSIYWVEENGSKIRAAPLKKDGKVVGQPVTLIEGLAQIDNIEIRGEKLFWSAKEGKIFSVDLNALDDVGYSTSNALMHRGDAKITTVLEGLKTPKGIDMFFWPCPKGLDFTVSTKYTERGDNHVYSNYPWATGPIIEMYQPTTFRVLNPNDDYSYEWDYKGHTYSTKALQLTMKKVGEVPFILREKDQHGTVLRELRTSLNAKYVRREIRSLMDEDRERFFDVLEIMVKTDLLEGRAKYGSGWQNNEYFVHMHNVLAGARDCDHLHSGRGFLFNHIGLTNEYEQNMQMVDPAVTIPFWDFTIDGHAIYSLHDGDFDALWNSVMFDPQWFGDARNDQYTVTEGRWAWALKIADEQWDNQVHNSYGLMRAPWNNNNFPYVQRFPTLAGVPLWNIKDGWPVCESHFEVIKKHRTWVDFSNNIAGEPHGSVHGILGGSMNFNAAYDNLEGLLPSETVARIREKTYKSTKALWRTGLRKCPEYCALDMPLDECKCSCGDDIWEKLDDPDVLQAYIGATLFGVGTDDLDALTYDEKKQIIVTLCEQITVIGDGLESASPADPIFWPIHPTVERLFVWKMLNGGLDEYEWKEDDVIPLGMDHTCYLHGPHDRMPWNLKMDDGDQKGAKTYTNEEMFDATNPTGDFKMPYVYDNFDWPHCIDEGFDFHKI